MQLRASMQRRPASGATVRKRLLQHLTLMLRAPDALHAAVCQRLGLTLVTLDRRLAAAARDLGVMVEALDA